MTQLDLAPRIDRLFDWINGLRIPGPTGPFRFSASSRHPTAYASCFALLAHELAGRLPEPDSREAADWCSYLQQLQDPATGLFIDPLMKPGDFPEHGHNWDYVSWQLTFFCAAALDTLGRRPRHSFAFLDAFLKKHRVDAWLSGLNWRNPWLISNPVMFLLGFLLMRASWSSGGNDEVTAHHILDWLDEHQNPDTGYWDLGQGADDLTAMAGAFHFYFFYLYLGRPIHHLESIVDHTLALQHPDGLYHPGGGGGSCHDLDAIDILVKCRGLTRYRAEDMAASLDRSLQALAANQRDSGAFCEAVRPLPRKTIKRRVAETLFLDRLLGRPWPGKQTSHAGWNQMIYNYDEGDMWSAWFRLLAIALIAADDPARVTGAPAWTFRKTPTLGWHMHDPDPTA